MQNEPTPVETKENNDCSMAENSSSAGAEGGGAAAPAESKDFDRVKNWANSMAARNSVVSLQQIEVAARIIDVHSIPKITAVGGFLAGNAGFLNAASWHGVYATTTTHMTGNTSLAAMALVRMRFVDFAFNFGKIAVYIAGAGSASLMLGEIGKFRGDKKYARTLMVIAFFLYLAMALAIIAGDHDTYPGLFCVVFSAGMQNAMATRYSGAIIRTTHVTGSVTDIGVELATYFLQWRQGNEKRSLWKAKILAALVSSFFLGGCLGTLCHDIVGPASLAVPATLLGGCGFAYFLLLHRAEMDLIAEAEVSTQA